jgi:hypothetical protein
MIAALFLDLIPDAGAADDSALWFFLFMTALGLLLGVFALIDRALERRSRRSRRPRNVDDEDEN